MGAEAGLGLGPDPGSSFKKAVSHFSCDLMLSKGSCCGIDLPQDACVHSLWALCRLFLELWSAVEGLPSLTFSSHLQGGRSLGHSGVT